MSAATEPALEQQVFEPPGLDGLGDDNPEPRLACVLVLDVSGSMQGNPIRELNEGLVAYRDALCADSLAMRRVEPAIVTFGGSVQTVHDFATVDQFVPPTLVARGDTPLGEAVVQGLKLLDGRKAKYKASGIGYYRPWVFLITDGGPTDNWTAAKKAVHAGEGKAFTFFAVGVGGANLSVLRQLSVREPLVLQGLRFRDLFLWLSASHRSVSQSSTGTQVNIPAPTWNTVV